MAAESTKYQLVPNGNIVTDFRGQFSLFKPRKSTAFVYGVVFVFIAFTVFLAFSPSSSSSSPSSWFINFFTVNNTSPPFHTDESFRSHVSPISSDSLSNSTQIPQTDSSRSENYTDVQVPIFNDSHNFTETQLPPDKVENFEPNVTNPVLPENPNYQNSTIKPHISPKISPNSSIEVDNSKLNDTKTDIIAPQISPIISPVENLKPNNINQPENHNQSSLVPPKVSPSPENATVVITNSTKIASGEEEKGMKEDGGVPGFAASLAKKQDSSSANGTVSVEAKKQGKSLVDSLVGCDLYDGEWVRDESYPLYKPGSCKLIDEQFNCFLNGRPDSDYQKLKWKPKGCTLPSSDLANDPEMSVSDTGHLDTDTDTRTLQDA